MVVQLKQPTDGNQVKGTISRGGRVMLVLVEDGGGTIATGVKPFMRRPEVQVNGGIALRDRAGRTRPTESGRGLEDRLKAGP